MRRLREYCQGRFAIAQSPPTTLFYRTDVWRHLNAIEAYIEFTPGLITDDGEVTQESTRAFLASYMQEFHGFITRVYMALPRNVA